MTARRQYILVVMLLAATLLVVTFVPYALKAPAAIGAVVVSYVWMRRAAA